MRVLITGGAGFIGSHIAEAALEAGHAVAVLDDLSAGKREQVPAAAAFFRVDVRDRAAVFRALEEFKPEAVSHQAAQASVSASVRDPAGDAAVNVLGSLNVMDACRQAGVRRFAFASTGGAIYGDVPQGKRAALDWPPDPQSPYAVAKYSVERYLRAYGSLHGFPYTILRYANVYGPRQDPHGEAGVVAIFLERLRQGKPLQINAMVREGDDGCERDYVYVADVVRANLEALSEEDSGPWVRNVCAGVATSTRRLAEALQAVTSLRSELRFAPPRAGDVPRSVLEPAPGTATVGLDEGLRRTCAV